MTYLCYRFYDLPAGEEELALLCPEEREQAASRGKRYLAARANLRRELGRILCCPPESLTFTYSAHGKPQLADTPLHFNLSHSGELLCLAIHDAPVGVDIQQQRTAAATPRLAERIMHPQQLQHWISRGCDVDEFFACWCAAEALVKHVGESIWQAKQYPFLWQDGRICPLFEQAPHIQLFTPAPGYNGAIVFTPPSIRS